MSTASPPKRMTIEEFLALPEDDSVDRMLIRGELIELPMTRRNKRHSKSISRICHLLESWLESRPEPRGEVFGGEAGVNFDEIGSSFGVDVVYFDAATLAQQADDETYLTGVPTLVVEILSPSDSHQYVEAKVKDYLAAGVTLIWVVDPAFRSVTIFEPNTPPRMVSGNGEVSCEPQLPGFAVPVSKFFARS
ncbi:Uma2 family endonuclease [Stratiformator vulcanicus]|uniref:Putative restriction endonuclease domain-containing protein n=1 Tax=Stratiformator vulcanicus TaxID=2527980 RepID=A0A517R6R5_9PLAN|nr:Uma2 family endonuclease [Stratiformator vulcanicus]QDT39533.1 hypothetical protein Pan189_39410 [Stratiformator vulcanicus]